MSNFPNYSVDKRKSTGYREFYLPLCLSRLTFTKPIRSSKQFFKNLRGTIDVRYVVLS